MPGMPRSLALVPKAVGTLPAPPTSKKPVCAQEMFLVCGRPAMPGMDAAVLHGVTLGR